MSALPKLVHSRVAAAMSIALLLLVATVALAQAVEKAVSIAITSVPTYNPAGGEDKMETVSGTAGGCANCRVVIYVRTNKWWVQPFADSPFTPVKDGKWSTDTHLGHEYAALLVRPAFQPPAATTALPAVGETVLAKDVKPTTRCSLPW